MAAPEDTPPAAPRLEDFLEGKTEALEDWRWLWEGDREFGLRSHRPWLGRVVVFFKRLLRPLVKGPQADLWDRQRQFNLVVLSHLAELHTLRQRYDELGRDLQKVQREILSDLRAFQEDYHRDTSDLASRLEHLELFKRRGLEDVMAHHDALFARLDQKLDRLRRGAPEPAPSEKS